MRRGSAAFFCHKTAFVESARIGKGTRIWGWSHVQPDVVIGEGCNIGEHCFIENGVRIGSRVIVKNGVSLWTGMILEDNVFVGPSAVFANERFPRSGFRKEWEDIRICEGASIGAGAVVLQGVMVGRFATVGAGALVTKSVADQVLVYGNPARVKGWMCICGLRLKFSRGKSKCKCGRAFALDAGRIILV
jgi:acetyltransferase-like isoleucine patch superfamily enzyme